ncbi:hypothetical protein Ple7327_4644 [Pleurocapsa sp. PCC 7327]|nr:hypothetical protein Ple7327_4644 [Pleurocapsa sp. PCC 7327]
MRQGDYHLEGAKRLTLANLDSLTRRACGFEFLRKLSDLAPQILALFSLSNRFWRLWLFDRKSNVSLHLPLQPIYLLRVFGTRTASRIALAAMKADIANHNRELLWNRHAAIAIGAKPTKVAASAVFRSVAPSANPRK